MRIDLLLTRLRFARSRSIAQRQVEAAHIRCNGQRVTRSGQVIRVGDVLTLPYGAGPHGAGVMVVEICSLPPRRGPAAEAQACYLVLDAGASIAIAGPEPRSVAVDLKGNALK